MPIKQALKQAHDLTEATWIISDKLIAKLSSVLVISINEISVEKPVVAMGLDSLVAIEVRSWVARELNAAINTMEMTTSPSLGKLVELIVKRSKLIEGLRRKAMDGAD